MKILKVWKNFSEFPEEYKLGEKAKTKPEEFVKDIIYKDGNFTDDGLWFKTFVGYRCEYMEFNEDKISNNN